MHIIAAVSGLVVCGLLYFVSENARVALRLMQLNSDCVMEYVNCSLICWILFCMCELLLHLAEFSNIIVTVRHKVASDNRMLLIAICVVVHSVVIVLMQQCLPHNTLVT